METASFTGFIKVLFYIILFYYIAKFLMRLLLPILLKKAVSKAEENLRNHAQRSQPQQPRTTQHSAANNPRTSKKVGEYVDFEEIE